MHCLNRTTVPMTLILILVSTVFVAPATAVAGPSCSVSLDGMAPPVCLSPSGSGFKLYFIGEKGVSQGLHIPGVADLAEMSPQGSGNVVVYAGTNPMSGALVVIRYLSDDQLIHVHTGIWDRHHEVFKPIIYVVDGENKATRWEADILPSLPPAPEEEMMAPEEEMIASEEEMMAPEEVMMAPEKEDESTSDHPRGEIDMVALHPATPVVVDTVGSDLVFYFVSTDGIVQGPRVPMVANLAEKHLEGSGNIVLYVGTNTPPAAPSAAPVIISYLSDDQLVHVHTFVWDSHNKEFKDYVFVIDGMDAVSFWVR